MKPDNDEFICTVADTDVHFIRAYMRPDHAANHFPILLKHESFAKMNLVSQNRYQVR